MTKRKMSREKELWMAQRAIVMQLLRDDHPVLWTRSELEAEIDDVEQQSLVSALAILVLEGVVVLGDETVRASPCARHLDALELLTI